MCAIKMKEDLDLKRFEAAMSCDRKVTKNVQSQGC